MNVTMYLNPDFEAGVIGPRTSKHNTASERALSLTLESSSFTLKDIKTLIGTMITVLRSDNGGEYRNAGMACFCKSKSIKQEYTVPYNPE